ncbi:MAG: stage III sporulation protein SpoIIIAB [Clostridia bacterium]|nr:stage III sporulation protein SpoIIIAB [Clostridia bacterium]
MVLKIGGSLLVLAASSLIGWILAGDFSRRPNELRALQGMLEMFETEITFMSNVIADAFDKISKSSQSSVALFFKLTAEKLQAGGMNACQAWEAAVKEGIRATALNKEDESILLSFGKMLGNSDVEGQVKNIRLTLHQLKLQEQKAEESRKKNESMCKSLGVLGGLAVVVVLC